MLTHSLLVAMVAQLVAIQGQVRDARTHSAIPLARVELWSMQAPVGLQYTDTDGRFHLSYPAGGQYTVSVEYPEYESAFVELDMPGAVPAITIDMARKKTPATSTRPVISLREYMAPKSARREFDLARKDVRRQDCAKAIGHFEDGLRAFDGDPSAYNDLGNCYRKLGALDRAEDSFKRAGALSDSVYVSLNLAEVYTAQRRFKEAEALLRETIRKQANSGDAYYGLSLVFFEQGLLEDAEAIAIEADKRPHQIADLHLVLAEIHWRKQESVEAMQQLRMYLKEAPNGLHSASVRQVLKSGPRSQ